MHTSRADCMDNMCLWQADACGPPEGDGAGDGVGGDQVGVCLLTWY